MTSMASEIIAFMVSVSGWVLVSSMLPTDYWKVSTIDGTVITTATYWANLWKTCVTDSTGVSNCKDFPSMLALNGYIQACRGLMIAAVRLGFFGSIFALFGMKCTKVGGSDKAKAKIACLARNVFILSGLCSITDCSLYANKITTEFFDPLYAEQKQRPLSTWSPDTSHPDASWSGFHLTPPPGLNNSCTLARPLEATSEDGNPTFEPDLRAIAWRIVEV
ncbi:PREDICTED: claudin-10-like [Chrysochloris asiatica]|uniref:Claudin n=1 Tax=Chrysochloris asiatica TaxID=185453 RepID=A0A9B0T7N1_CHRAS|nr:PREDICTED: claudin-10-like [Chrysochloris asiatica]